MEHPQTKRLYRASIPAPKFIMEKVQNRVSEEFENKIKVFQKGYSYLKEKLRYEPLTTESYFYKTAFEFNLLLVTGFSTIYLETDCNWKVNGLALVKKDEFHMLYINSGCDVNVLQLKDIQQERSNNNYILSGKNDFKLIFTVN